MTSYPPSSLSTGTQVYFAPEKKRDSSSKRLSTSYSIYELPNDLVTVCCTVLYLQRQVRARTARGSGGLRRPLSLGCSMLEN